MVVQHPKPSGGTSASRRVRVTAKAGAGAVEGEAVFTQQARSYRRLWAILLVLTGVLLVVLGVMEYADELPDLGRRGCRGGLGQRRARRVDAGRRARPGSSARSRRWAWCSCAAVIMLFGLIGTTGKSIRIASILAALAAVGAMVASPVAGGFALILIGAVLAFVGGILLRPAS